MTTHVYIYVVCRLIKQLNQTQKSINTCAIENVTGSMVPWRRRFSGFSKFS